MTCRCRLPFVFAVSLLAIVSRASAQPATVASAAKAIAVGTAATAEPPLVPAPPAKAGAAPAPAAAAADDDPDRDVNLAQPDFTLAALPTTVRLPRHAMSFRMTHRFYEPIADAGLGGLFGLDSGALVGIDFRFGLMRGWQAVFYRTGDKTIQFSTQYEILKQGGRSPLGIAALASVEGTDNFKDSYSPAMGAVVSREVGTRAALYAAPVWVNNTNPLPKELIEDNSTMLVGFGARLRVLDTTYVVAEIVPRVGGFGPDTTQTSFGVEKRAGGHLFQLTFANGIGTTWAQMARGGSAGNHWHLGFNLSRKFY